MSKRNDHVQPLNIFKSSRFFSQMIFSLKKKKAKLVPVVYFDEDKEYEMAVSGVELFNTFSNIMEGKNNVFEYSNNNGDLYNTIVIPERCYNLKEINENIQSKLEEPPINRLNGQWVRPKGIKFSKNECTDKVVLNVVNNDISCWLLASYKH